MSYIFTYIQFKINKSHKEYYKNDGGKRIVFTHNNKKKKKKNIFHLLLNLKTIQRNKQVFFSE